MEKLLAKAENDSEADDLALPRGGATFPATSVYPVEPVRHIAMSIAYSSISHNLRQLNQCTIGKPSKSDRKVEASD